MHIGAGADASASLAARRRLPRRTKRGANSLAAAKAPAAPPQRRRARPPPALRQLSGAAHPPRADRLVQGRKTGPAPRCQPPSARPPVALAPLPPATWRTTGRARRGCAGSQVQQRSLGLVLPAGMQLCAAAELRPRCDVAMRLAPLGQPRAAGAGRTPWPPPGMRVRASQTCGQCCYGADPPSRPHLCGDALLTYIVLTLPTWHPMDRNCIASQCSVFR